LQRSSLEVSPWDWAVISLVALRLNTITLNENGTLPLHFTPSEEWEVKYLPSHEEREIYDVFTPYNIQNHEIKPIVDALKRDEKMWVDFMMKFELGLDEPDHRRGLISALTIGLSYMVSPIH
jgi:hypothetical protein